jgi:arylsulfatase A-like enzyme
VEVNRRHFLQSVAASAAAAPFVGCSRNRQPNVVFVLSDDLRWDCMSVAGHPFLKTPNIDRIANEGVRFTNAFCTTSLCSPSRASFLSGLYAHGHQVINNFTEFPSTIPSYPQRLHDSGYHTAYIGKWHMVLNLDVAPSVLDFCGVAPLGKVHGASIKPLTIGQDTPWRTSWMYEYNFETEFPYTPNVRGVRTDDWSYMHYPNGDGSPDSERSELYNVTNDPLQKNNLIDAPEAQVKLTDLTNELTKIQQETGGLPDKMPIKPQLRFEMPDAAIR